MKRLARMACIVGLSLLPACGGGGDDHAEPRIPLNFTTIDSDLYSDISSARFAIVKDSSAWSALWTEHKQNHVPVPPLPSVDFSRLMVVGIFLGNRPNGCYLVEIRDLYLQNDTIVVAYAETIVASTVACLAVAPSRIVTIDRSDLPIEFVGVP